MKIGKGKFVAGVRLRKFSTSGAYAAWLQMKVEVKTDETSHVVDIMIK